MRVKTASEGHPVPRTWFPSAVPRTPAEQAATSDVWERKGPLARLVRR
ncbi:MAG TPA: hypothetical protein VHQ98_09880 [Gaiellaceae bacterium]|jgi:hypothetical protein|nr:hypothetical protein [Gaiellaceae bacterium]